MRYRPKSIGALHIALGGLPDKMRVDSGRGHRCVREERWRTSEAGGVAGKFGGETPQDLDPENAVKVSKASVATRTSPKQ